mmetsp:Transcript_31519/g.39511  ORF Transcript_31519/g.39511 Transcript_31519/m.39511 type:complete len:198 (+) Transcript_31519:93-686(+)
MFEHGQNCTCSKKFFSNVMFVVWFLLTGITSLFYVKETSNWTIFHLIAIGLTVGTVQAVIICALRLFSAHFCITSQENNYENQIRGGVIVHQGMDEFGSTIIEKYVHEFEVYRYRTTSCGDEQERNEDEEKGSISTKKVNETMTCCICLINFQENEELVRLVSCHHSYHEECITKWLNHKSSCPLCKNALQSIEYFK